jgi:ADP-ribose pyrophosphatase YjhB (NUDIX family)
MAFDNIITLELTQEEALLVDEALRIGHKFSTKRDRELREEIRLRIGAEDIELTAQMNRELDRDEEIEAQ